MFEQAELRGIPMGPNGPPNAKGTALIAPEVAILEDQAFWVILIILEEKKHAVRPFWPANSEPGWTSRSKLICGVWLRSTRPS